MNTQKDLSWLNSKWWYRLLKVFYVSGFLVLMAWIIFASIEDYSPYEVTDRENSTLTCLEGNQRVYSYSELPPAFEIRLQNPSREENYVVDWCDLNEDEYELPEETGARFSILDERADAWREIVQNAYELNRVTEVAGSWWNVVFSIAGGLLLFGFILEIVRRIFYYVVLGTLRPKKERGSG